MIDQERVEERLRKLEEYAGFLRSCQKYTFDQYDKDAMVRAAVERYFQLAIECVIDIGEILIAGLKLRKPEDSRDVIDILGENGIIPDKFAYHLAPISGFRNALVHDYLEIDRKKVYEHMQNDLKDFDEFARYVAKYITESK